MRRLAAALTLPAALALSALAGCSGLQLAYDNADTYLRWRLTADLDLHGEALDELDERIQQFMAWHRRQSLPQYARLADDASQRLARGLSREDMVWGYDALTAQGSEFLVAVAERIGPMLDRLTPEQQAHLEERMADDNRKFARDFLRGSEAERRERRARRAEERLEDWVGRLSQAQVDRIRQFSERAPLTDELRQRDRKRLQAGLLEIVRARGAEKRLPGYAARWRDEREAAFTAANEAWRRELYALLLDIDRTLAPVQRARAVAQLQRYAGELRTLAARETP
ncbi:MAG TPA: DUF6279 family lipoprotein [Burkholderiales bacterium]